MGAITRVLQRFFLGIVLALCVGVSVLAAQAEAPAAQTDPALQAENDKFWQHARQEVDRSVLELLAQNQSEVDRGIKYHKLMHGDPTRKEIALTFDDGPHPAYTPQLLALLKKYHVKATFFLVGEKAVEHPELVRAEVAAGHCIGNHTYHHVNLTKIPAEYVATELKACGDAIKSITGTAPRFFRPPGGDYDHQVAEVSTALGYTMTLWTDDPGDFASPGADVIASRLLTHVGNGGVILIHDGIQQTIDILPRIITDLRAKGYTFVTMDELARHAPVPKAEPGKPAPDAKTPPVKNTAIPAGHAVRHVV